MFFSSFDDVRVEIWAPNSGSRIEGIAKNSFPQTFSFKELGVDVCSFSEALGAVCLIFAALETSLKTYGFLLKTRSRVVAGIYLQFGHVNSYKQIAEQQFQDR